MERLTVDMAIMIVRKWSLRDEGTGGTGDETLHPCLLHVSAPVGTMNGIYQNDQWPREGDVSLPLLPIDGIERMRYGKGKEKGNG